MEDQWRSIGGRLQSSLGFSSSHSSSDWPIIVRNEKRAQLNSTLLQERLSNWNFQWKLKEELFAQSTRLVRNANHIKMCNYNTVEPNGTDLLCFSIESYSFQLGSIRYTLRQLTQRGESKRRRGGRKNLRLKSSFIDKKKSDKIWLRICKFSTSNSLRSLAAVHCQWMLKRLNFENFEGSRIVNVCIHSIYALRDFLVCNLNHRIISMNQSDTIRVSGLYKLLKYS